MSYGMQSGFWASRQLSVACNWDHQPKYLLLDNDSKSGENIEQVATHRGIELLRTPFKAPKANATCERFLGSPQRECLDHLIILNEQCKPNGTAPPEANEAVIDIIVKPVLGGLHHTYERK